MCTSATAWSDGCPGRRHDKGLLDRVVTRIVQTQLPDTSIVRPAHQTRRDRPTDPGASVTTIPTASATVTVAASPDTVYGLVSDLPRMGEWSPENTGGRWVGRPRGPQVGARFVGTNRAGLRWWPTTTVVTDAIPGRRFAFETRLGPVTAAEWIYEIAPTADGCELTESWVDRRNGAIVVIGRVVTGVKDRAELTRDMLVTTLTAIKQAAERRG
jgi:hypothetical protein